MRSVALERDLKQGISSYPREDLRYAPISSTSPSSERKSMTSTGLVAPCTSPERRRALAGRCRGDCGDGVRSETVIALLLGDVGTRGGGVEERGLAIRATRALARSKGAEHADCAGDAERVGRAESASPTAGAEAVSGPVLDPSNSLPFPLSSVLGVEPCRGPPGVPAAAGVRAEVLSPEMLLYRTYLS